MPEQSQGAIVIRLAFAVGFEACCYYNLKYNRIVKATGTASTYGVLVINASIKKKDRSYLIQNTKTGRYKDAPKSMQALNQKRFFFFGFLFILDEISLAFSSSILLSFVLY